MAELSRINPHRLRRLIEQNFDVISARSNDEEIVVICPESGCSDRTGNRSINLSKGITNCWRCSAANGHVVPFLRRHGIEIDGEDLEEIVSADPIGELEDTLTDSPLPEAVNIELPEGFTLLADDPDCIYARLIGQMAQRKKLYLQDFIDAGVGFTRNGEWEPFSIFPVYELGKLAYYQGRTYATRFEGDVTKKFPSKKKVPFGAGNWLYGYDQMAQPGVRTVIVVESILNVLSLRWELQCQGMLDVVPVAVFKHKISKVQLVKLAATQAQEICILYDGDATNSAWEEARKLSSCRKSTVAVMPVGIDANDDAKLAIEQFKQRQEYSPANALLDLCGI